MGLKQALEALANGPLLNALGKPRIESLADADLERERVLHRRWRKALSRWQRNGRVGPAPERPHKT